MDDPTAREVVAGLFLGREIEDLIERPMSDYDRAAYLGGLFAREDIAIIDTRTHVAVAREPSEETVERVARAIIKSEAWSSFWAFDDAERMARAAIAALVHGGEDEDV